jgi:dihydrolipoamide dehydrogenase
VEPQHGATTVVVNEPEDRNAPPAEGSPAKTEPGQEPAADLHAPLLVLGAGPGGYTAAFRAADLGQEVVLVERWPSLGGVCLNVGCIPSKALLHAARVLEEAQAASHIGIRFASPEIDLDTLRSWKDGVVKRLTGGLEGLSRKRKVKVVRGSARFISPHRLAVLGEGQRQVISFDRCIIAAGSEPIQLPGTPADPRIIDSTGALELTDLPDRMLVVGGGIIGLEMATVYAALGVKITVVELTGSLMPGCDTDLVRPLHKRLSDRYEKIMLDTRVVEMKPGDQGVHVRFATGGESYSDSFDKVLVAVGRRPNGKAIDAGAAGVAVDARGFIGVDKQMRTNVPHIFAIGDIVGQPMLAHKASHEGKVAAEVAAGQKSFFDARAIPSVAYTDPEVAWVGLTETEAKASGVPIGKGVFPWAASGRSLSMDRDEGITKLLFDPHSGRVLGAGIVGPNAGDLIAEAVLAIEMGCDAQDIGLSIHPHPTLSESLGLAAEAFEGTITDLYMPRKK